MLSSPRAVALRATRSSSGPAVLARYPLTPARRRSRTVLGSSCMVRMMIFVVGLAARTSLAVCSRGSSGSQVSGMSRSRTMTSGLSLDAAATAVFPVPASRRLRFREPVDDLDQASANHGVVLSDDDPHGCAHGAVLFGSGTARRILVPVEVASAVEDPLAFGEFADHRLRSRPPSSERATPPRTGVRTGCWPGPCRRPGLPGGLPGPGPRRLRVMPMSA